MARWCVYLAAGIPRHMVEMDPPSQPNGELVAKLRARITDTELADKLVSMFGECELCLRYCYEQASDALVSVYVKHAPKCQTLKKLGPKRGQHVGNGTHNGMWAFTLTKSEKDPFSVGDMLTAVRKVMRQKSNVVTKYAWYYEDKGRDQNGDPIHPHIHGVYVTDTGGRVEAKHWKRAWSIWDERKPLGAGFRGGYHRPVRDGEAYERYIKKDGGMSEVFGFE